ncbi:MAG: helix-hairpin-helix domain-containing protein [archaeon]
MTHLALQERIKILAEASKYDTCSVSGICHTWGPDGRCIDLYKTLSSNCCSGECTYCPNRCGRDTTRTSLSKDEIKKITWALYRGNSIEGLFLSSGIVGDAHQTTDFQIDVARELRQEGFAGYIHIRLMPGVAKSQIDEISHYADKFGINIETTSSSHYSEICPNFDYGIDAMRRMRYTEDIIKRRRREGRIVGANDTQFVVGAAGESDWEYLKKTERLISDFSLRRPYFMAFNSVKHTPLEKEASVPLWREHRLYQSFFLLKEYGFKASEFRQVLAGGNLQNTDPKVLLAGDLTVDINSADEAELLRVPGIGPRSAYRIINSRPVHSFQELKNLGVVLKRVAPYIELNGSRQERISKWLQSAC